MAKAANKKRVFTYTQNREVSWLRFDDRVLEEALDESVPLYERMKFCAIFQSNLDEWFMIRVGGLTDLAELKNEPIDNKCNQTPSQQLDTLFNVLPAQYERHEKCFKDLEVALAKEGIQRVSPGDYTDADLVACSKFYESTLAPILSPMIVDPRHPFPNMKNMTLYVVCLLKNKKESGIMGMVEVPSGVPRVVYLPSDSEMVRYTLVEDVIISLLDRAFTTFETSAPACVRVTRNADIDPDGEGVEEEEDYRDHMKRLIKRRARMHPVRLEINGAMDEQFLVRMRKELDIGKRRVFVQTTPTDLSYVYEIEDKIPANRRARLLFKPFEPQVPAGVRMDLPMREQIEDHDIEMLYPYESMDPLLRLIQEAATDDNCISIKFTLYRVAKRSRLCESLITASENGKEITVLMELRARFDEENNIEWAGRLEEAGCTVIYGSEGYKCHSKICQITYHDKRGISRITCLGTGNFNEKTARLYSDFLLMTAHPGIAEDGNNFFRNLSIGNLQGSYKYLAVAPLSLKPMVIGGIEREIEKAKKGEPARIFLKMNSLTDRDVIDMLAEASQAGVEVILMVRGICCLLPGIKGRTEGIEVRQIVGRLLEHSRIYAFGAECDTIYLSSADMMTRNTERRVEIAFPVLDDACRQKVLNFMRMQLKDNVKARRLTSKGTWEKIKREADEESFDSQAELIKLAYANAPAPVSRVALPKTPQNKESSANRPKVVSVERASDELKVTVKRGRFAQAMELFGEGFKTLFGANKDSD